ncbi:hypothetical protein AM1_B0351 (plasmid) [Acaryochloris marina MBIC11017]|uniref:Uncharacterized protein n=1 Tax=Acaryochloris marina (strain MBIC 11017) TaxID=329726 RepID=A8ZLP2_ACAM1|nr:hypothetical protein AM1_B0351 [Acaryochloris marina MBIC11017]
MKLVSAALQSSEGRFPAACSEEMELQFKSTVWEQIVFHTPSACSRAVDLGLVVS